MPSWNELLGELEKISPAASVEFFKKGFLEQFERISKLRDDAHVVFYASAFLQKSQSPDTGIVPEDVNGFMAAFCGLDSSKPLVLLLHTPGGLPTAAQTIVEYIRSKFSKLEVVVPTYAFSAGTMIALGSDRIVMGRQSQLGPIDPQIPINGSYHPASAIRQQFDMAKKDLLGADPKDVPRLAQLWAPTLQLVAPALLVRIQQAEQYGEAMVAEWLKKYMFNGTATAASDGKKVAEHFGKGEEHKDHARRISREEAAALGIEVEALEDEPELQDAVLSAYHYMTLVFERTDAVKVVTSSGGNHWVKSARS